MVYIINILYFIIIIFIANILDSKSGMKLPYNGPVVSKIKEWMNKRRENNIGSRYDELAPKIAESEKSLRGKIGNVIEMKTAIKIQAKHLQSRLEGCIKYNSDNVGTLDEPVESLKEIVSQYSSFSACVKEMLNFHAEILKQKKLENITSGKIFQSLPPMIQQKQSQQQLDVTPDEDHEIIMEKLNQLKESKQNFANFLSRLLEEKETFKHNLENCIKASSRLKDITHFEDKVDELKDLCYDHDRCTDCSYVSTIAAHCYNNLNALNEHALETNNRLHELVELREKMKEYAEISRLSDARISDTSPEKTNRIEEDSNGN